MASLSLIRLRGKLDSLELKSFDNPLQVINMTQSMTSHFMKKSHNDLSFIKRTLFDTLNGDYINCYC